MPGGGFEPWRQRALTRRLQALRAQRALTLAIEKCRRNALRRAKCTQVYT
jgi:hypothetical protein